MFVNTIIHYIQGPDMRAGSTHFYALHESTTARCSRPGQEEYLTVLILSSELVRPL